MASAPFTKKLKDLNDSDDAAYTEDFFAAAFKNKELQDHDPSATLKTSSRSERPTTIEVQYEGDDIDEAWLNEDLSYEGQLAVDVFQTPDSIIISSAVAGLRAEDLIVEMNGDMITIKGIRRQKFNTVEEDDYFIRECYWGGFSRSIILPVDIKHDAVSATIENGILTITLPKATHSRNGRIAVVDLSS